jgi:hypothetical protein
MAMNMRMWIVLGVIGVVGVLALPVLGQPSTPPYRMPGTGYMGQGQPAAAQPISIEQAEKIARQVLARGGYAGLALDEIQEFSNNFYVAVKYKTGGAGAFEFLIDRYSGFVHPEPQTMMWNTQFGHMAGWGGGGTGGGMMSGSGYGPGGMMGGSGYGPGMMGGNGYGPGGQPGPGFGTGSAQAVKPQVTAPQAKTIAQTFLNAQLPGTKVRNVDTFPGYYTLDVIRDGKVAGMLSVNAYTGQVWYHGWHGTFIQEKEID